MQCQTQPIVANGPDESPGSSREEALRRAGLLSSLSFLMEAHDGQRYRQTRRFIGCRGCQLCALSERAMQMTLHGANSLTLVESILSASELLCSLLAMAASEMSTMRASWHASSLILARSIRSGQGSVMRATVRALLDMSGRAGISLNCSARWD